MNRILCSSPLFVSVSFPGCLKKDTSTVDTLIGMSLAVFFLLAAAFLRSSTLRTLVAVASTALNLAMSVAIPGSAVTLALLHDIATARPAWA